MGIIMASCISLDSLSVKLAKRYISSLVKVSESKERGGIKPENKKAMDIYMRLSILGAALYPGKEGQYEFVTNTRAPKERKRTVGLDPHRIQDESGRMVLLNTVEMDLERTRQHFIKELEVRPQRIDGRTDTVEEADVRYDKDKTLVEHADSQSFYPGYTDKNLSDIRSIPVHISSIGKTIDRFNLQIRHLEESIGRCLETVDKSEKLLINNVVRDIVNYSRKLISEGEKFRYGGSILEKYEDPESYQIVDRNEFISNVKDVYDFMSAVSEEIDSFVDCLISVNATDQNGQGIIKGITGKDIFDDLKYDYTNNDIMKLSSFSLGLLKRTRLRYNHFTISRLWEERKELSRKSNAEELKRNEHNLRENGIVLRKNEGRNTEEMHESSLTTISRETDDDDPIFGRWGWLSDRDTGLYGALMASPRRMMQGIASGDEEDIMQNILMGIGAAKEEVKVDEFGNKTTEEVAFSEKKTLAEIIGKGIRESAVKEGEKEDENSGAVTGNIMKGLRGERINNRQYMVRNVARLGARYTSHMARNIVKSLKESPKVRDIPGMHVDTGETSEQAIDRANNSQDKDEEGATIVADKRTKLDHLLTRLANGEDEEGGRLTRCINGLTEKVAEKTSKDPKNPLDYKMIHEIMISMHDDPNLFYDEKLTTVTYDGISMSVSDYVTNEYIKRKHGENGTSSDNKKEILSAVRAFRSKVSDGMGYILNVSREINKIGSKEDKETRKMIGELEAQIKDIESGNDNRYGSWIDLDDGTRRRQTYWEADNILRDKVQSPTELTKKERHHNRVIADISYNIKKLEGKIEKYSQFPSDEVPEGLKHLTYGDMITKFEGEILKYKSDLRKQNKTIDEHRGRGESVSEVVEKAKATIKECEKAIGILEEEVEKKKDSMVMESEKRKRDGSSIVFVKENHFSKIYNDFLKKLDGNGFKEKERKQLEIGKGYLYHTFSNAGSKTDGSEESHKELYIGYKKACEILARYSRLASKDFTLEEIVPSESRSYRPKRLRSDDVEDKLIDPLTGVEGLPSAGLTGSRTETDDHNEEEVDVEIIPKATHEVGGLISMSTNRSDIGVFTDLYRKVKNYGELNRNNSIAESDRKFYYDSAVEFSRKKQESIDKAIESVEERNKNGEIIGIGKSDEFKSVLSEYGIGTDSGMGERIRKFILNNMSSEDGLEKSKDFVRSLKDLMGTIDRAHKPGLKKLVDNITWIGFEDIIGFESEENIDSVVKNVGNDPGFMGVLEEYGIEKRGIRKGIKEIIRKGHGRKQEDGEKLERFISSLRGLSSTIDDGYRFDIEKLISWIESGGHGGALKTLSVPQEKKIEYAEPKSGTTKHHDPQYEVDDDILKVIKDRGGLSPEDSKAGRARYFYVMETEARKLVENPKTGFFHNVNKILDSRSGVKRDARDVENIANSIINDLIKEDGNRVPKSTIDGLLTEYFRSVLDQFSLRLGLGVRITKFSKKTPDVNFYYSMWRCMEDAFSKNTDYAKMERTYKTAISDRHSSEGLSRCLGEVGLDPTADYPAFINGLSEKIEFPKDDNGKITSDKGKIVSDLVEKLTGSGDKRLQRLARDLNSEAVEISERAVYNKYCANFLPSGVMYADKIRYHLKKRHGESSSAEILEGLENEVNRLKGGSPDEDQGAEQGAEQGGGAEPKVKSKDEKTKDEKVIRDEAKRKVNQVDADRKYRDMIGSPDKSNSILGRMEVVKDLIEDMEDPNFDPDKHLDKFDGILKSLIPGLDINDNKTYGIDSMKETLNTVLDPLERDFTRFVIVNFRKIKRSLENAISSDDEKSAMVELKKSADDVVEMLKHMVKKLNDATGISTTELVKLGKLDPMRVVRKYIKSVSAGTP